MYPVACLEVLVFKCLGQSWLARDVLSCEEIISADDNLSVLIIQPTSILNDIIVIDSFVELRFVGVFDHFSTVVGEDQCSCQIACIVQLIRHLVKIKTQLVDRLRFLEYSWNLIYKPLLAAKAEVFRDNG